MRAPRSLTAVAVLLATAFAGTPNPSSSADPGTDQDRGAVGRAADSYGLPEAEVRAMLDADPDLRIAGAGLYFVDPARKAPKDLGPAVVGQAFPLDQTFLLHSKAGSQRTIFLDFDGHFVSGTWWNEVPNGNLPPMTHPAWTLDGDATTFNDTERMFIQNVFQRVAEDYAPFDVDVTTQDPGEAAILRSDASDQLYGTRALITPSNTAESGICNLGVNHCGGVAFIDKFDFVNAAGVAQPAWVFPQYLGPNNAKFIADAITHEVGHNLSLMHDGTTALGYYSGHGANAEPGAFLWGPMMGSPYRAAITQWGLNTYPNAKLGGPGGDPQHFQTNPDDIATIAVSGAPFRSDEPGNSIGTAGTVPGTGFISSSDDVDYYNLGTCSGTVNVAANNAEVSPNLDIKLELLTAGGTVVATGNPPVSGQTYDIANGLDASVSAANTPSATYYVRIDGIGPGDSFTNYDDYGSVGAYTLQVTGCGGGPVVTEPSVPRNLGGDYEGGGVVFLDWDAPADDGGGTITLYNLYSDDALIGTVGGGSTNALLDNIPTGSHDFAVGAVNSAGEGPLAHVTVDATDPDPEALPGKAQIGQAKQGRRGGPRTATVSWQPPAGVTNPPIDGFEFIAYKQNRRGRYVRVFSMEFDEVFPNVKYTTSQRGLHKFAVRAHNSLGYGPLSAKSNAVAPR